MNGANKKQGGTDKTYIWVKLSNGVFAPDLSRSNSSVTNKKRGAPSANGSGDLWGWAPGYYTTSSSTATTSSSSGGEEKEAGGGAEEDAITDAGHYHLTLLQLDKSADGHTAESEHTLPKPAATKLLATGDIVLANPWEGYDFVNRLGVSGDDDDDDNESDYDYDDDGDSDADGPIRTTFIPDDTPDDAPPSNLIELTHLHEPSVVHALRHRFENTHLDMASIYTDTGPILLAVNPFKRDDSGLLYGGKCVDNYRREGEGKWMEERREMSGGNNKAASTSKEVTKSSKGGGEDGEGAPLPPHVYGVADRVFRTMMTRIHPLIDLSAANDETPQAAPKAINQSVLVSGESGAGKTWTTKLLMAYLSKLSENPASSNDNDDDDNDMSIEKRILESNPVMESFGNARTIRNDNSSRFGKYIEMKFQSKGGRATMTPNSVPSATLVGASIETYLLEKVRLVHQSPGERNYHIFYELFSMKYEEDDDDEKEQANQPSAIVEKIGLLDYDMEDFTLINTSDTYDRRDGVPDEETFGDMKRAMSIMGFAPSEVRAVFEVTTALLHASNLTFELIGEVECALVMDNPHLEYVVDLLGITKEGLNQALCYYEITIGGIGKKGGETHQRILEKEQAEKGVEALIKATYGAMFDYLVKMINVSVAGDNGGGKDAAGGKAPKVKRRGLVKAASIGILDIFGFESFQVNSFEQLCINYCNEALQQQFNLFVLRNEQEEYDREGIPWNFIEFPENQDVLDLIAFKGSGILNILHDQCRTPGGSDKTFALAMYDKCTSHERFEADARMVGTHLFGVHHYAGLVEYSVEGFVEKTRDDLPKSGSDLLLSSNNDLVKIIADILQPSSAAAAKGKKPRGGAGSRPTVGLQFSSQLQSLRRKIDDTSPHYIRCIKPNNLLVPDEFDAALIADQLRCAGVIEAVRVSRLGYPQRFAHNQFIARYQVLGRKMKKKNSSKKFNPAKALVHSIAQRLKDQGTDTDDIGIQVGKTKVFLRRQAYDLLEKLRRERIASAAVTIQKNARMYVCRKGFTKASGALLTIQCFVRRVLAKKVVAGRRQQHNSIIIQTSWRKYAATNLFVSAKIIARWCQTHQRGSIGRQRYNELNREVKAKYLQSQWRGYQALKSYKRHIHAVLTIQCARRCYAARIDLSARQSEARDLSNVVQERDTLRHEAIVLRNELKKMKEESLVQESNAADVAGANSSDKDAEIESLQITLDQLTKEKEGVDNELKEVIETVTTLTSERDSAVGDLDDLKQVNKIMQTQLNSREEELKSCEEDLKSREEELGCVKKELEELKDSKINLNESSAVQESQKVSSTDTTQVAELKNAEVVELKNKLKHLEETNAALQMDNDQLKADNLTLTSKTAGLAESIEEMKENMNEPTRRLSETSEPQKDTDKRSMTIEGKRTMTIEEKNPGAVNPSVCTSVTADMDVSEEEMSKLREENQVLQKQLELLRVNNEFQHFSDDEFDDSVVPDSKSDATEYIGDANAVPDDVMKQILSEVEIVTEEVIMKTRAESESKIAELQSEVDELGAELERSKRLAKYDLDDKTRVNRSLREELERITEEKMDMEEELETKCEEFDALNEDVERFAETFAGQHGEVQQLELQTKKLQLENDKLKASDADKKKRIGELEAQSDMKKAVGSELSQLWAEIGRMKETSASVASSPSRQVEHHHRSTDSSSSDISSEESEGGNE